MVPAPLLQVQDCVLGYAEQPSAIKVCLGKTGGLHIRQPEGEGFRGHSDFHQERSIELANCTVNI